MNLYLDSSVVLRVVLGEAGALAEWKGVERVSASELVRQECLRTIDRARNRRSIPDGEIADRRAAVLEILTGFELGPIVPIHRGHDRFGTLRTPQLDFWAS